MPRRKQCRPPLSVLFDPPVPERSFRGRKRRRGELDVVTSADIPSVDRSVICVPFDADAVETRLREVRDTFVSLLGNRIVQYFCQTALFVDVSLLHRVFLSLLSVHCAGISVGLEHFFAAVYMHLQINEAQYLLAEVVVWWLFRMPGRKPCEGTTLAFGKLKDTVFLYSLPVVAPSQHLLGVFSLLFHRVCCITSTSWFWKPSLLPHERTLGITELLNRLHGKTSKHKFPSLFREYVAFPLARPPAHYGPGTKPGIALTPRVGIASSHARRDLLLPEGSSEAPLPLTCTPLRPVPRLSHLVPTPKATSPPGSAQAFPLFFLSPRSFHQTLMESVTSD
eukprot:TRINITY_DN6279_c0_g1_i2.p1 TRINITY_DN6279_c0_g1~~TRINITY_DN6279_c0_g1_i2.p1  ORF type:complete len:337 (-),score=-9.31 TRINITY_DN6279_c0_g1_i2:96-1106(-)